jgi:WD40 repeat protein
LSDGLYHSAVSADGRRFAGCSPSGVCRLFDEDLRQLDEVRPPGKVGSVQLSHDGSLLVVGLPDGIHGYKVAGNGSPSFTLPVRGTSLDPCVFVRDEPVVCVASWDKEPVLAAYDLRSSKRIAEHPLPRRGGEGYSLVPHPEGEAMAAIAFSGNSEDWLFWAHYRNGRLRIFQRPEILDVSLPHFDPSGAEFVSRHERLGLCRMRFPSGELIGSVSPEDAFPSNPEYDFDFYMHCLSADRVLAWQSDLALYEFDLKTLRPTRCVLNGVDGRTFGQGRFSSGQSWKLAGGRLLTSDVLYGESFQSSETTLRLWDASALYGPLPTCDPARPLTQQLLAMPPMA